ncbi:hypothetical protein [Nonomuraea sp. bgisy101]|uniref:hypothetical protein n=1 Tax=Nonomuraea sp. bgisy101 TaxID=3413784 RepID=UPI003D765BED
MGYRRKKTIKISFGEGHEFEGLTVWLKSVGIGALFELLPHIDLIDMAEVADATTAAQVEEIQKAFRHVSKLFEAWNIEDEEEDGTVTPVPCTYETLLEQDPRLIACVLRGWAEHLSGVPAPLDEPSPSGDPFQEASLPMEVSSPSLAS